LSFLGTSGALLFFNAGSLWRSDGSPAGTFGISDDAGHLVSSLGSSTFVTLASSSSGLEPGITDGTVLGTSILKDIAAGDAGSIPLWTTCPQLLHACVPSAAAAAGTRTFFVANDLVHGYELWSTDGTADGTQMVADIRPGAAGSIPSDLTAAGSEVYFSADDGVHGRELWKSDGTAAGTLLVADIVPGSHGSSPGEMIRIGSSVWFQATGPFHGMELWRSDGSAAGTQLVSDINPGVSASSPMHLTASGGSLFFSAFHEASGREAWVVDLAPQVDAVVPASGNAAGGESVTIRGWSFAPDATATIGAASTTSSGVDDWTMTVQSPAVAPGTLHDVVVRNAATNLEGTLAAGWFADFLDVPPTHPFHDFIETLVRRGISTGCGGGNYCASAAATRAQMAIVLLRSAHGPAYQPPPATGTIFADVPANAFAAAWIEELYRQGITAGCAANPLRYCPAVPVTRAQIAVFLLRTHEGSAYVPPPAGGIFADVPPSDPFAPWIEELHARSITSGCAANPLRYCPSAAITRGQMAVFAVRTFAAQ
jgi:ELWxxDGT repeat protein